MKGALRLFFCSPRYRLITHLLAVVLVLTSLSGCAITEVRWNPDAASADAQRDIDSGIVRFAYVGGDVPVAIGIPQGQYETLRRFGRLEVGSQGCIQEGNWQERHDYARRYNEKMWTYVSTGH